MNIVFFDDEDILFSLVKRYFDILKVDKYVCFSSAREVENYIINNDVDILFIDFNIPEIDDINTYIEKIYSKSKRSKNMKLVVTSGEDNNYVKDKLKFSYIFLKKPFLLEDLRKIIYGE